jgi:hypothetical protein
VPIEVSTGLHRFVTVCTSLFCNRIIVKYFTVLYRYGVNTGTNLKRGSLSFSSCFNFYFLVLRQKQVTFILRDEKLKVLIPIYFSILCLLLLPIYLVMQQVRAIILNFLIIEIKENGK